MTLDIAEVVIVLISERPVADRLITLSDPGQDISGAEAREVGGLVVAGQEDSSSDDSAFVWIEAYLRPCKAGG